MPVLPACSDTECSLDRDRVELMNSVADLRLDNKRLQERNQELQLQMENSDEHFKGIQRENEQLQGRLKKWVCVCVYHCVCVCVTVCVCVCHCVCLCV